MPILNDMLRRIFSPSTMLTLMGEGMLQRIIENPDQPLLEQTEKGYGLENIDTYDTATSFTDLCRQGQANGSHRMDVSYDFFFGGDKRENYPDSPLTVEAYKVIHDLAREHGMGFGASVISPLDTGGEYVKTHKNAGQTMQFKEGLIREDGSYATTIDYQTQWTNNKGPAALSLKEVKVFAFDEERIAGTPFYYVDEQAIVDISDTVHYTVDPDSLEVTPGGYGHGNMHLCGRTTCGKSRFLAVVIYRTLELDYFSADALPYMKSIIDQHHAAGITYDGIYSDEMHIQFDWDMQTHWDKNEVTTRYMTGSMAQAYADLYGEQYRDFPKYLVYFAYMQHDFLDDEEGALPTQHVFGKSREDIVRTFLFRKRYFDLLHSRVVGLCTQTKEYAEALFGHPLQATGHSTWQESPTADMFYIPGESDDPATEPSHYDYTPRFGWSAAQRENISACNDHFKWNEYFWTVGTDIPEGGFLDRNYYGAAVTSSLAALNPCSFAYYCIWGAPDAVKERLVEVGQTYGHYTGYCHSFEIGHNLLQGCTTRLSDVLAVYPLELNYLEERFGNWMVQYGYTDYITEEKLLEHTQTPDSDRLRVNGRAYRALVVFFSPLMSPETLTLLRQFVEAGGTVLWCSVPALREAEGATALFRELFGIRAFAFDRYGIPAQGERVRFSGFATVEDMPIPTALFPDYLYPITAEEATPVATVGEHTVGTVKHYPSGGKAVYLGFRVRDDQSGSTGKDVHTLFSVLRELGAYDNTGSEALSRPADRRYLYNMFPNGAVSLCNHFRTFRERDWPFGFYRDDEKDAAFMKGIALPPHDIQLQNEVIADHRVTYRGEGIVTYRYDEATGLLAFAGRNTDGIVIDGNAYRFTDEPANVVWGKLDDRLLGKDVRQAYIFKCNKTGRVRLPFTATGMTCALCANYMLEPVESHTFTVAEGTTLVDVDAAAADRWILFYQ